MDFNLSDILNLKMWGGSTIYGHLNLEYTDIHPDQIAADVVSLLEKKAQEKGLALEHRSAETTPQSIVSDPTRVRQILLNLVGNAIKFTQSGSVKINCSGCKTESGNTVACFEVSDTGIGISESQKNQVFEVFAQADETITRRFGGTGLGLALAKKLARSLGGDVSITKSVLGKGSTFLLQIEDLPGLRNTKNTHAPEVKMKHTEPQKNALKGIKILVVDDSLDNQFLIFNFLSKYGAIVDFAENGEVGYQKTLVGDYHVVLMDIQMPVMDGYTATGKLRQAGYKKTIIALSAHAMSEVRQKCLDAGYTSYLTKPINVNELITTIAETLH